jgi:hypothetical protein
VLTNKRSWFGVGAMDGHDGTSTRNELSQELPHDSMSVEIPQILDSSKYRIPFALPRLLNNHTTTIISTKLSTTFETRWVT